MHARDHTLPLFPPGATPSRFESTLAAFDDWIAARERSASRRRTERALRKESASVYRDMWQLFAAFCEREHLSLAALDVAALERFLAERARAAGAPLNPRYAWRLLMLVDRVCACAARTHGERPNPAAKLLIAKRAHAGATLAVADPLPEYLPWAHAERLIAYLGVDPTASGLSLTWKELRARAALALMLGAGLSPGECRAMPLTGVLREPDPERPWKLQVPGNGNSAARETPLAGWAAPVLALWLTTREALALEGPRLFPSTRGGRAWSQASCYTGCNAVLAQALGEDGAPAADAGGEGGLFRLRHSFVLRQLELGKELATIARWLGVAPDSLARYRRVLARPVAVS